MNVEKEIDLNLIQERLSIEVTTHCNINCSHCFVSTRESERTSLSIDLVKEIITEGYNTGYRHLHITGGEPLLWEGLCVALDYAFSMGYETIFMNTNGTLLTEAVSVRLGAHSGLTVSVSIDGPRVLHDRLRGEGSYNRTVRGVKKALDVGVNVFIFAIATKSLVSGLPRFADEIYRRYSGIKYLTLIPIISVQDCVFTNSKELLDPEDFVDLVWTVAFLNVYGLKTDILNDPLVNVVSKMLEMPWIPQTYALYRDGSIIIMANRDICLSHSSRDSFCKYETGMIHDVLSSDEYRKAVARDEKLCPLCKYAELCMENGKVRPTEWHGDMYNEVHYCKRVLDSILL
jgi:MoaA/NifB/PqqE/SkfB family radical SAM enzyme